VVNTQHGAEGNADQRGRASGARIRGCLAYVALAVALVALGVLALAIATRPVVVPRVIGMPEADAVAAIERAYLGVGIRSEVATRSTSSGYVVAQSPAEGTKVRVRSKVGFTVSVTPSQTVVPDLIGEAFADANSTLVADLFVVYRIDAFESSAAVYTVMQQVPKGGTMWETGLPVAVVVSAGPDDGSGVAVPDLTGKTVDEAIAILQKAGLKEAGFVTNLTAPATNLVVGQAPMPKTVVRPGTTVLLLFKAP
jgi:beta-lactam-binding protein with PASTA domain